MQELKTLQSNDACIPLDCFGCISLHEELLFKESWLVH